MSNDLCDDEVEVLKQLAGLVPAEPWGGALSAILGCLKGSGHVNFIGMKYSISEKGREALRQRGYQV